MGLSRCWKALLERTVLWAGIVLLALAGTGGSAWAAEKRIALVVGNARYPTVPLNNPENDAHVVASTLRRLGFEVTEHVNLPVKDFRRILREYAKRVQDTDGTALFFYAGHGVQIDGRNYLLPVDINVRDEYEVKDEAVDIDELFVSRLERARAPVRIVILDACRDNPFANGKTRGLRTIGSGLVEMGARGALIAYSSAPGATAEDGPAGTNSVFTRHLVKEMLIEGLEVEQMFKNVRVKVLRDTNQRQIPWVNSSMVANFSFNPRSADPAEGAKREDLVKLQASLDKREREQKDLEEKVKKLSAELEQAQAAASKASAAPATKAAAPAAAPASAPAATKPVTEAKTAAKGGVTVEAKSEPKIEPKPEPKLTAKDEAKSAAPTPKTAAASAPRVVAKAEPKAATPKHEPKPAEAKAAPTDVKFAQGPSSATPKNTVAGRKGEGRESSERCVALLIRAQLGESLPPSDLSYLQKECR